MKPIYTVTLEATIPVQVRINIRENGEAEATALAVRIAECQRAGVKTAALEIEAHGLDFLRVHGAADVVVVEPHDVDGKVWDRGEIEKLLRTTA